MREIVYLLTLLERAGQLIMIVALHRRMIRNSQIHPLRVMPLMHVTMMSFVYMTLPPLVGSRLACQHWMAAEALTR